MKVARQSQTGFLAFPMAYFGNENTSFQSLMWTLATAIRVKKVQWHCT